MLKFSLFGQYNDNCGEGFGRWSVQRRSFGGQPMPAAVKTAGLNDNIMEKTRDNKRNNDTNSYDTL